MTITKAHSKASLSRQRVSDTGKRSGKSGGRDHSAVRLRAERFVTTEIQFMPNPSFPTTDEASEADRSNLLCTSLNRVRKPKLCTDMPAHLARLCEAELLSACQERELFKSMNYLKYKANALRSAIDPNDVDVEKLETAEQLLADATAIRDRIVQANTRLVMSVVKKFVSPQHPFDDMFSDGIETLIGAVDKFDYDRGFRFSTYAYRSIARSAYRTIKNRQKEQARYVSSGDEVFDVSDEGKVGFFNERTWDTLRGVIVKLLGQLDPREQFIIRGRYTLGDDQKKRTFQSLADELGVSKERTRQLEQRAMVKLRTMAADCRLEELFAPSLA